MINSLKRTLLFCSYPIAKSYWFIFRPKTFGAKVIITCGDEVLLIRHSYASNNWTFSGGGIKVGETPEQAAIREIKKELQIDLTQTPKLLGKIESTIEYKRDTIYVLTVDLDQEMKKKIQIDQVEITESRWFPISNVPVLSPLNQQIMSHYVRS